MIRAATSGITIALLMATTALGVMRIDPKISKPISAMGALVLVPTLVQILKGEAPARRAAKILADDDGSVELQRVTALR